MQPAHFTNDGQPLQIVTLIMAACYLPVLNKLGSIKNEGIKLKKEIIPTSPGKVRHPVGTGSVNVQLFIGIGFLLFKFFR